MYSMNPCVGDVACIHQYVVFLIFGESRMSHVSDSLKLSGIIGPVLAKKMCAGVTRFTSGLRQ